MRSVVDMETIPYFPGCTCKADALPFEVSAKAIMRELVQHKNRA